MSDVFQSGAVGGFVQGEHVDAPVVDGLQVGHQVQRVRQRLQPRHPSEHPLYEDASPQSIDYRLELGFVNAAVLSAAAHFACEGRRQPVPHLLRHHRRVNLRQLVIFVAFSSVNSNCLQFKV